LERFVSELAEGGRADLAQRARAACEATVAAPPHLEQLVPVVVGERVVLGGWELEVDPTDGAVVHLRDPDGRSWATREAALARWSLQSFDAADFERWFTTYNGATLPEDLGWARWDNTKPGLEHSGAEARWRTPSPTAMWRGEIDGCEVLVVELRFGAAASEPVSVPAIAYLTITAPVSVSAALSGGAVGDRPELSFELSWFDLPAARWPVAWWWSFAPAVEDASGWRMEKLGELVAPLDVVPGGAHRLHAADRLVHPEVSLELVDAPLAAPGAPRLLQWDEEPVDLRDGWHLCLYDNLWGTNFPMWIEGDGRARVGLRRAGT
jgi:hypothetical protein